MILLLLPPECEKMGVDHCLRVLVAVKRHLDHGNSYKGKLLIGAGLQFPTLSPWSSWCDMVTHRRTWCWSWESYILLSRQQEANCLSGHDLNIYEPSKPASTVTPHFLQQDYTYFNKVTSPNSATPGGHRLPNHHSHHAWNLLFICLHGYLTTVF